VLGLAHNPAHNKVPLRVGSDNQCASECSMLLPEKVPPDKNLGN
jgi:hypothetical protein